MGFYDTAAMKEAALSSLRADGWEALELPWSSDENLGFELTHPELSADGLAGRLELDVHDPGMPGSWIVAAREAYYQFDQSEESYDLWRAGAVKGIARAEDLSGTLSDALVAKAREIDSARGYIDPPGAEPARRTIFDDDAYIDPEDFRDVVFDHTDGYDDPADIPDDVIWREMAKLREVDLEDELGNVDSAVKGHPFVAVGTLGLWDGRPKVSFIAKDFEDAYRQAMGRDCEYFRAWDENGRLMIDATHHDGTNSFELRALTDAGVDLLGEMDADTGIDAGLLTLDCYSERPRVAERVYDRPAIEWEKVANMPTARADAARRAAESGLINKGPDAARTKTI